MQKYETCKRMLQSNIKVKISLQQVVEAHGVVRGRGSHIF
jgi:hypothetical protein